MRKPKVYVAGPIQGSGNYILNIRRAVDVGTVLLERGFVPFIPHLDCFWHFAAPSISDETWMEWDFEWVSVCDALLRLEGVSPGADREILHAVKHGIPVFYSLDTLFAWKETFRG